MRQYYDVYCLLDNEEVQQFIGTEAYVSHKKIRFPAKDFEIPIAKNQAFLLSSIEIMEAFTKQYERTKELYYKGQPPFKELLDKIHSVINRL